MALFLLIPRVVNSPFGRVSQAIRENAFRAEALGYRTVVYRTLADCIASAVAALSFTIMADILLMVVIGGMGTLYGPALGAAVMVLAQFYLQPGLQAVSNGFPGVPVLPSLFHPDRWLLCLGLLFVLIVYFFPAGIIGSLRRRGR